MAFTINRHAQSYCGCFIFSVTLLLFSTTLSASDWPEFRGPTRNGISTEVNVPIEWSATDNVVWKQAIPGEGWSSPALVDEKIYLTTATGSIDDEDLSLRTLCVDASDGQIIWNVEVVAPSPETAALKHGKNGLASPTPLVVDDRVIVHFGHMGTAALDLDGHILWLQTDVKYDPRHGNAGSPALIDDLLVYSCDGLDTQHVVALDLATGDIRWKTPRHTEAIKKFSFSTPQTIEVDDVRQVVSPGSGFVAAYAPADGRELWRVDYGEGFSVVPRPVYAHGRLYVATGFAQSQLLAIDPHGANGDATKSNVVWRHQRGVPNTSSMLVVGDEIYFVSDKGVATCLDAHTGKVHWTKRLGGNYSSSPIYAEDRIYFTSEEGDTHVIRASTEYELLITNHLEERIFASAVPAEGTIYLRSESHLWRIGQ
jgi:outer membrane protein assembly factor BamB